MPRWSKQIYSVLALIALSGCEGQSFTPLAVSDTACGVGEAKILILDGLQQRLCGCAEPAATVSPPASLTCTLAVGTRVFLDYTPSLGVHQIVPTGTPALEPSPVSLRKKGLRAVPGHTFVLGASGTYAYTDAFFGAVSGQFIVP